MSPEDSFDWDELLLLIEDRLVIPIVGRELLVLPPDEGNMLLEEHLARRLAETLEVPLAELSGKPDLNEVAVCYLRNAGVKAETRKRLIQKKIELIMGERTWPTPEPLKKLAAITHFDLFVSTSFDSMLRQAIDESRFGGESRTRSLAYYLRRNPDDIPAPPAARGDACVYQIFGTLESSIDFAVTDEDRIETLHRLQGARQQPAMLFDELREKNLLFLGCGFPDGLARILVRTLTNKRLFGSNARNKVADSRANADGNLGSFLRHCGTETYVSGNAADFADALYEKWKSRVGPRAGLSASPSKRPAPSPPGPEPGSIFLSYKSADVERVALLKDALERAGLMVWFDKEALRGGDDWDQKIDKGIENCTLFIPIISRNSQTAEGEFRREWIRAIRRAERIPREIPFIVATLIDSRNELRHGDGSEPILIPKEFWGKQTIECLNSDSTGKFVETVMLQMKEAQLLRGGLK